MHLAATINWQTLVVADLPLAGPLDRYNDSQAAREDKSSPQAELIVP